MEKVGEYLREKILIVQDDLGGHAATPELVSQSGYATALVRETNRAVEKISQESPDLVIFDLGVAPHGHLDLLSQLKSNRFTSHIPVVVLGSPTQTANRANWITVGADDILDFPFHSNVLSARLRAILRRHVTYHPLTHLPASSYLQRQVDAWLAKNTPTAVLYVDIDHFASYNSSYGREAGDRVLQSLAHLIVDQLPRGTMSVAHMGDDDFMVAFPPAGVETFVETLINRFRDSQDQFYSQADILRGYIEESEPGLGPHRSPLMTLSVAVVTNEQQRFTSFLHACSLLCKQMGSMKEAKREADLSIEPYSATRPSATTLARESYCRFYTRICKEFHNQNLHVFEEYAPVLGAHFSELGDHVRAASFYSLAGDRARHLFDLDGARGHYANMMANLAQLPQESRYYRQRADAATRSAVNSYGIETAHGLLTRLTAVEPLAHALVSETELDRRRDRFTVAQLHFWIGQLLNFTDGPLEGIAFWQQAQDELEALGEEELAVVSSGKRGLAFARQGHFGRSIPLLRQDVAYFESKVNWWQWMYSTAYLAVSLAARGQVAESFSLAGAMARRAQELNSKSALAVSFLYQALVYILGGELEKSTSSAQACVRLATETRELSVLQMGYGFKAWGESALGNMTASRESFRLQGETASQLEGQVDLPDLSAAIRAETALRHGSSEDALTLAQQAIEVSRQIKSVFAEGIGERVVAKATALSSPTQYETAERHLISSVNAFESGECLVEVARTRVVWGLLAAANGNLTTAKKQLEGAASQFQSFGLEREAREAREVLFAIATPD